jgi:hypothetical protein
MEKNQAIVLKTYLPQKQKVCLLDAHLGKIMAVPHRQDIGYGSLLVYFAREWQAHNQLYMMQSIELIDMPLQLAADDILFLHHVLELCYFFLPLGHCNRHIFHLVLFLYTSQHLIQNSYLKKVFLFQFFSTLGLYPQEHKFQQAHFHYLASTSIDIIAQQAIDLMVESELDNWLLRCIEIHPCARSFKTVHFLHSNRVI